MAHFFPSVWQYYPRPLASGNISQLWGNNFSVMTDDAATICVMQVNTFVHSSSLQVYRR